MKDKKIPSPEPQENIELPEEIWIRIFSLIDPESLLSSVQLTNTHFYSLTKDRWIWEKLFKLFFPEDLPSPFAATFDWRNEFITLYRNQYGSLTSQTRRYVFLIAIGAVQDIYAANFTSQDLQADQFILIKTAVQFRQQAILDYFYSQQQLKKDGDKSELYWATLCNQQETVNSLLEKKPSLINEAIFEEDKTAAMLAAEVGHLTLMKGLITHPNKIPWKLNKEFKEFHQRIVRNGQLTMANEFDSFIKEQQEINTLDVLEPMDRRTLAFRILIAAADLPSTISLAARYGSATIFKARINQLHQKCLELQEYSVSRSPISKRDKDEDENELFQFSTEREAQQTAKSEFDWEIHLTTLEASQHGHVNILRYVLENNFFEIDRPLSADQETLLCRAVQFKQLELIKFLLKNQADPELALLRLLNDYLLLQRDDYSEIISLLLEAIEERNKLNNPKLIQTVIARNRADILKRLFAIDPQMLTKTKADTSFLCQGIMSGGWACVRFLLKQGVEVDVDSFHSAFIKNDSMLAQELLNRAGYSNAPKLVNSLFYKRPMICYADDPDLRESLLPHVNMYEAIKNLLSQECDITDLRNLIDYNDQVLKNPPIDKDQVLALAKEKKQKSIAAELRLEIELEKEAKLEEASLSREDLTFAQLNIQIMTSAKQADVKSSKRKFEPTKKQPSERKSPKLGEQDSPSTGRFGLFTNSDRETAELLAASESTSPSSAAEKTEMESTDPAQDDSDTFAYHL
ncbi:F-box-like domain-containing protein [Legionella drozanskii]|uniref:Ankyrin repeats (3 copies) n=1 Tax=Legionella drozanskii LLAP-1 TaxID=1212489 RepID=A0A0W0SRJ3_9GAMM|nr:F-box-like domain-containing protein [Legionella drozanskii]KTC85873.1 Ankyrin repeats (3 copies) [Legionella drozanskii LLAP-1]